MPGSSCRKKKSCALLRIVTERKQWGQSWLGHSHRFPNVFPVSIGELVIGNMCAAQIVVLREVVPDGWMGGWMGGTLALCLPLECAVAGFPQSSERSTLHS